MKLVKKVRVQNQLGLHTRPATVIVQMLQGCSCSVSFTCGDDEVNAKSLLSLLMLAAAKNTQITVTVEGQESDVEKTMQELVQGFNNSFGE